MVISVNGHPLALKKGSSFEYISENRLFSGSDAYTLSITFPLKDCPQNIEIFGHINRIDVALGKIIFDCEIRDKSFYKFGSLTVVEISRSEVKCQFLEGRSETNYDKTFDKVYINELDLGTPEIIDPKKIEPGDAFSPLYNDNKYVALPWVNNNSDSGMPHNFVDLHLIEDYPEQSYYSWAESTEELTWQPYLLYIIRKICESEDVGYEIDLSELEKDVTSRYLLICNTLPGSWDIPEFARALPHWTVEEFFSKLELFLGGEFDIDHRNRKITFRFSKDILTNLSPVYLDKVVEEFSSELSDDESDCEYLGEKNIKYKDDESTAWKYYSCNWFINQRLNKIINYDTLKDLLDANREDATSWTAWNYKGMKSKTINRILYAKDIDTYFVARSLGFQRINFTESGGSYTVLNRLKLTPINIFGEKIVSMDEDSQCEEIEFKPVPVDFTDFDHGFCMSLNVGTYSEVIVEDGQQYSTIWGETTSQQALEAGGINGDKAEYFDSIYIGWWPGVTRSDAKMPYPIVDKIEVKDDWSGYHQWNCYSMRLGGEASVHTMPHRIDPKRKVSFKFIADSIPDVRTVFFIHGKRYICEKISSTFTETGMSQLLKGDFYPIID